jgi:hypothetical protein
MKRGTHSIREMTRELHDALGRDEWPSPAACIDFGIASEAHYGALQHAVLDEGVSPKQLDAALGKGDALQALVSPRNPYPRLSPRNGVKSAGMRFQGRTPSVASTVRSLC